jgi:hypothetical protein
MIINIRDYILLSKEERQTHLDLSQPCVLELCENEGSLHHVNRGRLSLVLGTSVPSTHSIQLCHACNNKRCSNPFHHYWGTGKENHQDQVDAGTYTTFKERYIAKHGLESYEKHIKQSASKGGAANAKKKKSEEHRRKISESLRKK